MVACGPAHGLRVILTQEIWLACVQVVGTEVCFTIHRKTFAPSLTAYHLIGRIRSMKEKRQAPGAQGRLEVAPRASDPF